MWAKRLGHDIYTAKKGPPCGERRDTIPSYMMTRRSALAAFAGVLVGPSLARSAQKATAFALIGDRYHNSDYIRDGLEPDHRERDGRLDRLQR